MNYIQDGRQHWSPNKQAFKNYVIDACLEDIRTIGAILHRVISAPTYCAKNLTTILENNDWLTSFTKVMPRGIMDHSPLLLNVPIKIERYHISFQFFNFMINIHTF